MSDKFLTKHQYNRLTDTLVRRRKADVRMRRLLGYRSFYYGPDWPTLLHELDDIIEECDRILRKEFGIVYSTF